MTATRPRIPLIPITSTHPSLLPIHPKSSIHPSTLSLAGSQKRPSAATSSPGQGQGRRKTSRTEKGAIVTASAESTDYTDFGIQVQSDAEEGNAEAGPSSGRRMTRSVERADDARERQRERERERTIVTPRVRDILGRDDLGTGKSPARRLFADVDGMSPSRSSGRLTTLADGLGTTSEAGDVSGVGISPATLPMLPAQTTPYRLAPSPPMNFTPAPSPCSAPDSTPIAHLPPAYTAPDQNGVQRSIHDPGFVILADILSTSTVTMAGGVVAGIISASSTGADSAIDGDGVGSGYMATTAPRTPSKSRSDVINGELTPATPTTPATPRRSADANKENVPPPRDSSLNPTSATPTMSGGIPKAPSSQSIMKSSIPADWSKPSPSPSKSTCTSTSLASSAHSSGHGSGSEAEVDAYLSLGLSPSRYHTNSPSRSAHSGHYSPHSQGASWIPGTPGTPGHVRVKSKLAEEILRSPTRKGRGRGQGGGRSGRSGEDVGDKEEEGEGELTPGPITRRRAKMIRS